MFPLCTPSGSITSLPNCIIDSDSHINAFSNSTSKFHIKIAGFGNINEISESRSRLSSIRVRSSTCSVSAEDIFYACRKQEISVPFHDKRNCLTNSKSDEPVKNTIWPRSSTGSIVIRIHQFSKLLHDILS